MITRFLIVVNVLVFIWEIVTLGTGIFSGNVDVNGLVNDGALVPIAVTQYHEYWRIITGAFLHGSILHIAVNIWDRSSLRGSVLFSSALRTLRRSAQAAQSSAFSARSSRSALSLGLAAWTS